MLRRTLAEDQVHIELISCEWDRVAELFRSEEPRDLREAIAIINCWKMRYGKLSHLGVEMSIPILQSILAEKEADKDDWICEEKLALLYNSAIIRFLNYVNEFAQERYKRKQRLPMAEALTRVGVPKSIVEVRHKGTHRSMPSLVELRSATNFCRHWLWNNHWSKPLYRFRKSSSLKNGSVSRALRDFSRRRKSPRKNKPSISKTIKSCDKLEKLLLSVGPRKFIEEVLCDGYLILTEEQLKEAAYNMKLAENKVWNVPTSLQMFWAPVLQSLMKFRLLPEFLHALVNVYDQQTNSVIKDQQLLGWIHLILTSKRSSNFSTDDWKKIFSAMIRAPYKYSSMHFKIVQHRLYTVNEILLAEFAGHLLRSSCCNAVSLTENAEVHRQSVYTVADLKKLINREFTEISGQNGDSDRWTLCDMFDWEGKCIPLGLTPFQTSESLDLVVRSD